MTKKKTQSRIDAWRAYHIARAVRFSVVMFVGRPKFYDTRYADSLAAARDIRRCVLEEYGTSNYGRGAIIYAITPEELTIFVE